MGVWLMNEGSILSHITGIQVFDSLEILSSYRANFLTVENVPVGGVDAGMSNGILTGALTEVIARELFEGAVALCGDDDGLSAVVGDELVSLVERHGLVAALAPLGIVRGEDALEGFAELRVEDGVDDGIEGGVGVAQPREDLEGDVRDARLAEGRHDVDAEERHPADQEHAHDDAHRDGRFVVAHVIRRAVVVLHM